VCVVACALLVAAAPSHPDELVISPPTYTLPNRDNATRYVKHAHRASLNFACAVDRITVTPNFADYSAGFEDPLTQIELEDHLGEVTNIEWAHVMQHFFASTDSRAQERQLGTLGGDLGEFLTVLAAIEKVNTDKGDAELTKDEVITMFRKYLTVMSRAKFYFDTDVSGINNFKERCGCPQLNIADPPDAKKGILLNATWEAESHGDEFFASLLGEDAATTYGIRTKLVHHVLEAFFTTMWDKSDVLHRRIKFVLLQGTSNPKGFMMVKTPGYCNAQLLSPMISPELCGKQMGVYHGDAAVLLRTEMAGVLSSAEDKNLVVKTSNDIAAEALPAMLAAHVEPIYTVVFEPVVV
jgi:hypothetical protein